MRASDMLGDETKTVGELQAASTQQQDLREKVDIKLLPGVHWAG